MTSETEEMKRLKQIKQFHCSMLERRKISSEPALFLRSVDRNLGIAHWSYAAEKLSNEIIENNGHTTHNTATILRMRRAISPGQWQPWTAVSS